MHSPLQLAVDQQVSLWALVATTAFQFLEDSGYQAPVMKLDVAWGSITYHGPKLGICLSMEAVGFSMHVLLFRRGRPSYNDSKYLSSCQKELDIPSDLSRRLIPLFNDFRNMEEMTVLQAEALRDSLALLEANAGRLFPQ